MNQLERLRAKGSDTEPSHEDNLMDIWGEDLVRKTGRMREEEED